MRRWIRELRDAWGWALFSLALARALAKGRKP